MQNQKKLKSDRFTIKYVNYGIANRFSGKHIEINKKLKDIRYKELLQALIKHEKAHTDDAFSIKDIYLDIEFEDIRGKELKQLYWKFFLTTPSAWVQLLPLYKSPYKGWSIDVPLLMFWICLIAELILLGIIFV